MKPRDLRIAFTAGTAVATLAATTAQAAVPVGVDLSLPVEISIFIWGLVLIAFGCIAWLFYLAWSDHRAEQTRRARSAPAERPATTAVDLEDTEPLVPPIGNARVDCGGSVVLDPIDGHIFISPAQPH